jgi:molybdopterin molybdotransferase
LIGIAEALAHFDGQVGRLETTSLTLAEAAGRVMAEAAVSTIDLPPFSQSAMDGFAVRAADTLSAGESSPVRLDVVLSSAAGSGDEPSALGPGQAARILTGARLPGGADAVARQEIVTRDEGSLLLTRPLEPGCEVRWQGEELSRGDTLLAAGTRLGSGALAALAHAGVAAVSVSRRPRVSCVVTGDELVAAGRPLENGQIYSANDVLVSSWLRSFAGIDAEIARAADTLHDTRDVLERALDASDLVITTGGVSVGDRDHVIAAAQSLGVETVFWRVRQLPGKPLYFGVRRPDGQRRNHAALVLGLPGNPGSVFACLLVHVRRVLDLLEGVSAPGPQLQRGLLTEPVPRNAQRARWVRCSLGTDEAGSVRLTPLRQQASHMISNLGECAALALVPEGMGHLQAGAAVDYLPNTAP